MGTKLFIYGTLKRGFCREHLLRNQKFLGEAVTERSYAIHDLGNFPALVKAGEGKAVTGELWEVDERCLARLDLVEGSPSFYRREPIFLSSHPDSPAESYFFQQDVSRYPECGTCWPSQKET